MNTFLKVSARVLLVIATFSFVSSTALAHHKGRHHHNRRPRVVRLHDPKVNTKVERRYDFNHDGRIGPKERRAIIRHR